MIIRGNTIGTTMKPEKTLVKSTDMTPEEQAKARQNIGAASAEDIGNISTALDAIIAIQEQLMGGSGGTITFTIDEEECTAEEGMTWREWIGSPYDITGGDFVVDSNGSVCWDGDAPVFGPKASYVYADDTIIAGASYHR